MTQYKKGESGNPAGRPKGTPNKLTKELRKTLKIIISDEIEQIPGLMNDLEPKDRIELVIKLMPFVTPKIQAVGIDILDHVNAPVQKIVLDKEIYKKVREEMLKENDC